MTPDRYDRFIAAFWREMKRVAVEPALSLGELIGFLAWMAYRPPWWFSVPLVLTWIIWRNSRTSDARQGSEK